MRFEKVNDDKIRITLDLLDLKEKEIDYQSFMSNSMDTQKLFLDMLDEAEERIGFETKDYKIAIEAAATIDGNFVLTVTRMLPEEQRNKLVKAKRRNTILNKETAIYSFTSFEDFCHFCHFIQTSKIESISRFSKKISLYYFENTYYLLIEEIRLEYSDLKYFYSTISEFGKFVHDSNLFRNKLMEYGKCIMKNNAIRICNQHFANY